MTREFTLFGAFCTCLFASLAAVAFADYGPQSDIKAARTAQLQAWKFYCGPNRCAARVVEVTVVSRYALVAWTAGESGGQSLLKFDGHHWHRIGHGGGVMDVGDVEGYGVPRKIASQLIARQSRSR